MNSSEPSTVSTASFFKRASLRLALAALGLVLTVTLVGCGGGDMKFFDSGYNGQTVTVERGKPVPVRMIVNIQVGSKWEIVELDRSILDMRGEPRMHANIVTGGLPRIYSYDYMFHAVREGQTTLKMRMVKSDTGEVLDTFEMTVVVKK